MSHDSTPSPLGDNVADRQEVAVEFVLQTRFSNRQTIRSKQELILVGYPSALAATNSNLDEWHLSSPPPDPKVLCGRNTWTCAALLNL